MRIRAIGRNMSRITSTSASARTISARPATSSGRDVKAALMTDQGGGGCANVRDASAGTGPSGVERKARVDHGFGASHLSHERAGERLEPGDLDLGAKHVGLRRGSAGVSRIRRADDVSREHELLGNERCRPPPLLQHQEGGGRLDADIQGGPVRIGS